MTEPYQILGVAKSATADEIKSAYRKLAKKLHPDVNPGRKDIEQKFKEVTAAYDLLSDADKRARYDRGEIDAQGQERGFGGGGHGGSWRNTQQAGHDPFSQFGGMEDIFAEFMGGHMGGGGARGRRGPTGAARGSDVTYTLNIPFTEACLGGKRRVTLTNDRIIDVTIPAGSEEGHKLRLKGQGLPGAGLAGDAIVEIHIEAHPFFTRQGRDIHQEVPVSLPEAILGASINVQTLDGQVAVKVPKAANTGTVLRLKGKGVASKEVPGDMFVKLKIVLPEPVPQDLTDFMEKWAKKHAYDPRKKAK